MERPIPSPGRDLPMSRSKPRPSPHRSAPLRSKTSRASSDQPDAAPAEAGPRAIVPVPPEKTVHVRPLIRDRDRGGADAHPVPTPASPALRAAGAHDPAAVELVILIPVYKHSV